jgi:DNA-directed RNA polymerase subunit RPC12/RpoP
MKGRKKVFLKEPPVGQISGAAGESVAGHYASYLCLDCVGVMELDSNGPRVCSNCGSEDIKSVFDMVGLPCPKCKSGVFEEKVIGIS